MPSFTTRLLQLALCAGLSLAGVSAANAQRHSLGSAPPTVPPVLPSHPAGSALSSPLSSVHAAAPSVAGHTAPAPAAPIAAVSAGLGAIQFSPANVGVPAPQTLARQLSAEDERIRLAALSALGAPGQYLSRGHASPPHSLQLDLLQLGSSEELDAMLTLELDQHVVSAILVPEDGNWRRVATLTFASSFNAGAATPSNFVRPLRSWLHPGR
ncbi:MAG: hypothetical protein INR62_11980, partial [Rhodospirillales bacterium]|nr:hypothetical protein [Acetobacter sp.]